jgi:hypothetical protein
MRVVDRQGAEAANKFVADHNGSVADARNLISILREQGYDAR